MPSTRSDIALSPQLVPNQVVPLNWTNSVTLRLGYELLPTDLDMFRFGYTYHGSPCRTDPESLLDGILVHGFSLGYSRRFNRVTSMQRTSTTSAAAARLAPARSPAASSTTRRSMRKRLCHVELAGAVLSHAGDSPSACNSQMATLPKQSSTSSRTCWGRLPVR